MSTQGSDIESVQRRIEGQLLQLPNVTGVGVGEKDGTPVIKVYVIQKLPESALRPEEIVPKQVEGQQLDVEEIGVITAQLEPK
jgi:hypothetical protein